MFFGCKSPEKGNKKYKITYQSDYDTYVDNNEYSAGDTITLPDFPGWQCSGENVIKFLYWTDGSNTYNGGSSYVINFNVTLQAMYDVSLCEYGCSSGACISSKRALGEACTSDDDCQSGLCRGSGGSKKCAIPGGCESNSDCGNGEVCNSGYCSCDVSKNFEGAVPDCYCKYGYNLSADGKSCVSSGN